MHSQKTSGPLRKEASDLLRLAGPLIANNLALAGINFSDTVMAGRLGADALAAVAVGNSVWILYFLTALGTLVAMSPTAAHAFAEGHSTRVGRYLRQSLWLSQFLALIGWLLFLGAEPFIRWVGIDPEIVPVAGEYLRAQALGLPAILAYLALRFTSEGLGHTRPVMYMAMIGLAMNVAGNYILMYGKFGFPALGAVGCGYSSAISMTAMFVGMLVYVRRQPLYRPCHFFRRFDWPSWPKQRELLALGLPIGFSMLAEVGLFASVGLMMGTLGAIAVAGHQIALNYCSTVFMIPLAIHSAIMIRVGQASGRHNLIAVRRIAVVGLAMCVLVMLLSALAMVLFRHAIVGLYTRDAAVAAVAGGLLGMAVLFQLFDGAQVGAAGALRGLRDTRIPMYLNFFAYWGIGFPLAWWLGIGLGLGPRWVWAGLVAGLFASALFLGLRLYRITREPVLAPA